MNSTLERLKVLRKLKDNALICAMANFADKGDEYSRAAFLYEVYAAGAERSLKKYVQHLVLLDENALSLTAAANRPVSAHLKQAFIVDLIMIEDLLNRVSLSDGFTLGAPDENFSSGAEITCEKLIDFYYNNGYGIFIDNVAFTYSSDGLAPIANVSDVQLDNLKNYEREKKAIDGNISAFVDGLPCSDMLLYGDRGTGKSSTVHAMLNKYKNMGLRLVELPKTQIANLGKLKSYLGTIPLKFIVFIDDLTLSETDEYTSVLKAAIEGSVSKVSNVMIVATSNRRHVIRENFTDRENSVHPADSMEEQLSLADRFGLTVMFSSTDKAGYLSIVRQLAADFKVGTDIDSLCALAERWALENGGRSPRRARQFVEYVYSCEKLGRKIDF